MKYVIPAFFFCFLSFSQAKDSINNSKYIKTYNFSFKLDSLPKSKPSLNYKWKVDKAELLSVYDRNTQLNAVYFLSNDSVYFVKNVNSNANQIVKKDSFNPNGASNIGVGLIMGAVNTVFGRGITFKSF